MFLFVGFLTNSCNLNVVKPGRLLLKTVSKAERNSYRVWMFKQIEMANTYS